MALAEIIARLGLDQSGFQSGIGKAQASLNKFGNQGVADFKNKLVGAFAVGAIAQFAKTVIDSAAHINDLSLQTGVSTENIQKLGFAASQSGSNIDTLAGALFKLGDSVQSALSGNTTLVNTFDDLGVSVNDLRTKSVEDIFLQISDAVEKTGGSVKTMAQVTDVLGKSARELTPLLKNGSDGIRQLGTDAAGVGAIMSSETIQQMRELNDEFAKIKTIAIAAFAPLITTLAKGAVFMADLIKLTLKLESALIRANPEDALKAFQEFSAPRNKAAEVKQEVINREFTDIAGEKARATEDEASARRLGDLQNDLSKQKRDNAFAQLDAEQQIAFLQAEQAAIEQDLDSGNSAERELELLKEQEKVKNQILILDKNLTQESLDRQVAEAAKQVGEKDEHLRKLDEIKQGEGISVSSPITDSLARIGGFVGGSGNNALRVGEKQLKIQEQILAENKKFNTRNGPYDGGDATVGN